MDVQNLPLRLLLANIEFRPYGLQSGRPIVSVVLGPRSSLRGLAALFLPPGDCRRRNARFLMDPSDRISLLPQLQNLDTLLVVVRRIRPSFSVGIWFWRLPRQRRWASPSVLQIRQQFRHGLQQSMEIIMCKIGTSSGYGRSRTDLGSSPTTRTRTASSSLSYAASSRISS